VCPGWLSRSPKGGGLWSPARPTAIVRGDLEGAQAVILPRVPEAQRSKIARFLDAQVPNPSLPFPQMPPGN